MTRCAGDRRVFFVEEPLFDAIHEDRIDVHQPSDRLHVVVPHLKADCAAADVPGRMRSMLNGVIETHRIAPFVLWYWTPMALAFTRHLRPAAVVFDCMDELSGFAGAPAMLRELEHELLCRADVVFAGGQSLYEARATLHPNIHLFPSSVDVVHFARARARSPEPPDQVSIPRPRLGYFGVIDERMDLPLLDGVASARPEWHLVLVGPTAKIDPVALPRRDNIHYLGIKPYDELPLYLAGWDVALMPFARNDATRFISPTKTPEYLAAGRPVVSTSIRDVVRPYGEQGLVQIADTVPAFVQAIEGALAEDAHARQDAVDRALAGMSWDSTWARMDTQLAAVLAPSRERLTQAQTGGPATPGFASSPLLARAPDSPHDI